MPDLAGRDRHLVLKALAIAILTIEADERPTQSHSDMQDMRALFEQIAPEPSEQAMYFQMARIALPPD